MQIERVVGRSDESPPDAAARTEPRDVVPYLDALRMARADLLTGEIRGERLQSAVDDAVDRLLNGFYTRGLEPNRGRVVAL